MVSDMKAAAVFLLGASSALFCAGADLAAVHTVYLLPMPGSLDQYLAHRITSAGVFEVVTDPAKADALFTGQLGETFEKRLAELFPPPPAPKPPPEAKPAVDKDKDKADKKDEGQLPPPATVKDQPEIHYGGGSRGRGTVFLVDGRNGKVLWSVYENPKNSTSGEVERTAGRIVDRLKQALKKK